VGGDPPSDGSSTTRAVRAARCCCPRLIEDGGFDLRAEDPGFTYPDAHRVRLDVGTGVCVANEQLGGTRAGTGHDIAIEAVDEPMGDELFPPPEPSSMVEVAAPS
jgi:hypothetical protein